MTASSRLRRRAYALGQAANERGVWFGVAESLTGGEVTTALGELGLRQLLGGHHLRLGDAAPASDAR